MANSGDSTTRYSPNRDKRPIAVDLQDGGTVSTVKDTDDKEYRQQQLDLLSEISIKLGVLINHMRAITEIGEDEQVNGDY